MAPLVAVSRGHESLTYTDTAGTAAICKRLGIDKRRQQGRRFAEELYSGDIMVMPWFLPDLVARSQSADGHLAVTSMQYRPTRPAVDEEGRERKYEFVSGDETILGAHPATPGAWFADPDVPLLIAEGQLKADSAMTGSLLDAGVPPDALRLIDGETVESARERLLNLVSGDAAGQTTVHHRHRRGLELPEEPGVDDAGAARP